MKSFRWLLLASLLLSVNCRGWPVFPADPPKPLPSASTVSAASPGNVLPNTSSVSRPAAKQAIPQALLDALALCERDREAIATAQVTVDAATAAKAKAILDCENDYKALVALLESLYGPVPIPPTPPVPPTPPPTPPPNPPTPPPVVLPQLTLVTATGSWCQACVEVERDIVPSLKTNAGLTFKEVLYTDAEAAKVYPESVLVPRWVLTRPDGKVEKKIGYMTTAEVDQWIGKGAKP